MALDTLNRRALADGQAAWDAAEPVYYDEADRLYDEARQEHEAAMWQAIQTWPLEMPWGKRHLSQTVGFYGMESGPTEPLAEVDLVIRAARGEDIKEAAIQWLKKACRAYGESEASK